MGIFSAYDIDALSKSETPTHHFRTRFAYQNRSTVQRSAIQAHAERKRVLQKSFEVVVFAVFVRCISSCMQRVQDFGEIEVQFISTVSSLIRYFIATNLL